MGKSKFSANKKEELKKKREEPLSTSIGDLLKAKGMAIPESPKPNKKNNHPKKKATIKSEEPFTIKGTTNKSDEEVAPKQEIDPELLKKYQWAKFANDMLDLGKELKEDNPAEDVAHKPNVFHVGKEYITKEGSDTRVRTDTFITKDNQ